MENHPAYRAALKLDPDYLREIIPAIIRGCDKWCITSANGEEDSDMRSDQIDSYIAKHGIGDISSYKE